MAETYWPPRKLTVADNADYVGAQGEPVLVLGDDGLVAGMALHDGITLGGVGFANISDSTGAVFDPRVGATLTVPCALSPITTVWSLRITSADTADTVTVYETIAGVETSIGTLSVPAYPADGATDSYQKQFGATYRCAQAGSATLTAEVM